MTQTPPTFPDTPPCLAGILMNLVVALLAPMFLIASAGDIRFARLAAIETVNAYRVRNHADLIAVAQIIGFGLAALGSLSLSMADDISLTMTLRLRGNAVALNRSAEQNRRVLRNPAAEAAAPWAAPAREPAPVADEPETLLDAAAERELAAESEVRLRDAETPVEHAAITPDLTQKRQREMWAIAMVKEAGELHATLPDLPEAERRTISMRIGALSSTAHQLLTGQCLPPPNGA